MERKEKNILGHKISQYFLVGTGAIMMLHEFYTSDLNKGRSLLINSPLAFALALPVKYLQA